MTASRITLTAALLLAILITTKADEAFKDEALAVVPLNTKPGPEYQTAARLYQGVPSIARDANSGRLWAAWYSGGRGETKENYVLVVTMVSLGPSRCLLSIRLITCEPSTPACGRRQRGG
jgi:hypothetical protein